MSMVTLFEHCIFSSRFIIVLLVDFNLRMAFSKWKPNNQVLRQKIVICHSLCRNLEMLKLLVILAVIKYNMLVFRKCQVLDKM